MKQFKRAALLCFSAALCLMLLSGCGSQEEGQPLSVCVGSTPISLDPIYAEVPGDQSILVQLYENLMRVTADPATGAKTVTNGMAKNVDQDPQQDGSVVYTFKLRNAEWSDGQPVTANDFVYAWQRLANPASQSPYASLLSVVAGYEEARSSGDMSLLQVTAKNDSTLVVTLDGHYDWFLTEVCTSPATMPLREDVLQTLKEQNKTEEGYAPWWSEPTALVTNGAYTVASWDAETELVAASAAHYDHKHAGPSAVHFRFAPDAEAAWELYHNKDVDMVWPLPEEELEKRSRDKDWVPTPELSTHALLMNYQRDELADPLVRSALGLALDRNELAALKGVTAIPAEGLVPPGVPENEQGDFRTAAGPMYDNNPEHYSQSVDLARQLLEEAGIEDGSDMEPLTYYYVDEGSNRAVAEAMSRMWKEALNIHVEPKGLSELDLWIQLRSGDYQLLGVDLVSPGNDAECFLMEWTSDSQDNLVGYENSAYDTLMNIIATANSEMARMGCLHDAEVLLLSDNVVVPLYTEGTDWALRDSYSGLCRDPRGWFSFNEVYPYNG